MPIKPPYPTITIPQDFVPLERELCQRSLVERIEQVVRLFPENIAVRSGGVQLTYRQFNEEANRLARAILARVGDYPNPIAILMGLEVGTFVAMLAILKAGKPYVILDANYPTERLRFILQDTQAALGITQPTYRPLAQALLPSGTRSGLASAGRAGEAEPQTLPSPAGFAWLDIADPASTSGHESTDLGIAIPAEATAYVIYTSGSTGEPKGVIRTHANTLFNTINRINEIGVAPSDRLALVHSVGFEASRTNIYGAFLTGGTLCCYDIQSQGLMGLPDWLEAERISIYLSTPSTFRHAFAGLPKNRVFKDVRVITFGGEVVTSREVELFRQHFTAKCVLVNNLGSTEAGAYTRFILGYDTPFQGNILPAGYPAEGFKIELHDENGAEVTAVNSVGEIVLKCRYLTPGYWNNPQLTAQKFQVDPQDPSLRILRSGDLGRWRADGNLEYLGRKDTQVKIRGFRVEVAEVEAVLHQHPAVKDVAVIAADVHRPPAGSEVIISEVVRGTLGGEKQLIAYVVPEPGTAPSKKDLRSYVAQRLPDYMVPAVIFFLEALPLTSSGKVNYLALPSPEEIEQERQRLYIAPRDEIERTLARIWEGVLGVKPVGVCDDFFELGGNSLLAAQLFSQIEKEFAKKLPLALLFQASTVEQQADILRQKDFIPDWSSLVALRAQGTKPPLFFASPVGGNVLSYRDLIMHLPPDQPCYGLQALGLDGVQTPQRSVPDIAAHYVREIKTVQPQGPYTLAGSSFGGLVAYEMAQILHDQGDEVALVVMFDTYGPDYPRRKPGASRLRRMSYKLYRRLEAHLSSLLVADWKGRLVYLRVKGKKLFSRLARYARNRWQRWWHPLPRELRQVRRAQMGAAKKRTRYMREPRRFGGRLVLFKAAKQPLGIYPDDKLGWGVVVGDAIEVYELPGHHTSIIYEPRVPLLAEQLRRILAETQK